ITAVVRSANGLSTTSAGVQVTVHNTTSDPSNLIPNPSMEDGAPLPTNWLSNAWGTNTTSFTYENTGHTGSHSVKTTMTSYTRGDGKWYFSPFTIEAAKTYTYRHFYKSTASTDVVVGYVDASNNWTYQWIKTLPASADWQEMIINFTPPA